MEPFTSIMVVLSMLVGLALMVFWLSMFWDLAHNDYLPGSSKNNWAFLFVFLNVFSAVWYYFVEYRPRHL
jgi:hypothetical protein